MQPKSTTKYRVWIFAGVVLVLLVSAFTRGMFGQAKGATPAPVEQAAAAPAAAKQTAEAPTAQPAEPSPKPLELQGVGPFVTGTIHVPTLMRIVMTNSGREHFSVQSVAEDGSMRALYANDSGTPFDGSASIAPGDHILQIDSESTWTIRIEPLNAEAAAGAPRPEPTPEATAEPSPEPTPKPTQIPILSATGPPRKYYGDVRRTLQALNDSMIELVGKTTQLRKNPSLADDSAWLRAWAAKGAAVQIAADSVQELQRYQGAEPLLDEVTAAADDAKEAVTHLASALDAEKAGDTATNEAELAKWERTKESFRTHVAAASELLP